MCNFSWFSQAVKTRVLWPKYVIPLDEGIAWYQLNVIKVVLQDFKKYAFFPFQLDIKCNFLVDKRVY